MNIKTVCKTLKNKATRQRNNTFFPNSSKLTSWEENLLNKTIEASKTKINKISKVNIASGLKRNVRELPSNNSVVLLSEWKNTLSNDELNNAVQAEINTAPSTTVLSRKFNPLSMSGNVEGVLNAIKNNWYISIITLKLVVKIYINCGYKI